MVPTTVMKLLGAAALLAIAPAAQGQHPTYDAVAWAGDFAQLKAELENSYVNLAWAGSPESDVDVPQLERRARAALAAASNDGEARDALLDFVAGFHDGHLSERPYLAKPIGPVEPEPAAVVLDARDPAGGCAALGYAATNPVLFSLPFESLPGFVLLSDGLTQPFRVGLVTGPGGNPVGLLRLQRFRPSAYPAVCPAVWAGLRAAGTPLTPDAIEAAAEDIWHAELARSLTQIGSRGAKTLIVDVGQNGGGNDSGDWAVRLFTDRPVASARLFMVAAPVSDGYFDEQIGSMTRGLTARPKAEGRKALEQARAFFARQKASMPAHRCDLSWVWRERRPWRIDACNRLVDAGFADGARASLPAGAFGDRDVAARLSWATATDPYAGAWTRPVYVLTDDKSMSSAEMFAAAMKDNGVAKTIGQRTGGAGCGFMTDGPPLILAHSRLRFRIPNCLRLRADGTNEVAGIAPDFALPPTDGESARARAAHAVRIAATDAGFAP